MEKLTFTIESQQNGDIKTTTCYPSTSVLMWTHNGKLDSKFYKARDIIVEDCLMETFLLPEVTHTYWRVIDIKNG